MLRKILVSLGIVFYFIIFVGFFIEKFMFFAYEIHHFNNKKSLKSILYKSISISSSSTCCSYLVQTLAPMKQVVYQGVSKPIKFFQTSYELREYFELHHPSNNLTLQHNTNNNNPELWIGFYKKGINSELSTVTYQEAVDEALCFGWIDGIRKKIDDECYTNRFTPRKHKSNWSNVNIQRFIELNKLNKVHLFGQHAFLKENDEILLQTKVKSNKKKRPLNSE